MRQTIEKAFTQTYCDTSQYVTNINNESLSPSKTAADDYKNTDWHDR